VNPPVLKVRALTEELWPAMEDLFESGSACKRCWCMYWRIGSAYRKQAPAENKAALLEIVRAGPPPGLLAFDGERAIGWCQLTRRDALPWLNRTKHLKSVTDRAVWCISCFYVRKGCRKRGVSAALIVEHWRRRGKRG
jgi:hypothetical protein